ncbi:hypothetical protein F751_1266 [Auxenochlorella protothecoides]|uniref:Uncharacterized protein n=1 Tax=Auxenochlorella protothecoides TaxID=3075 RepID=A0A087SMY9_AUXPR|nr:hypothetical protein F751_1266 [Auxenochlorella protothecoides]KFM27093.1 hypothetical protein F751_1266 [Auxenochlorella protothecoides]
MPRTATSFLSRITSRCVGQRAHATYSNALYRFYTLEDEIEIQPTLFSLVPQ